MGAKTLGELARPGQFFDLTRYRPRAHYVEDQRVLTVPNSTMSYAWRQEAPDYLFFHLLEPHAFAEEYIESILDVLKTLGVKRHCRVGASLGSVPHTRPLPVSYSIAGQQVDAKTGERVPRQRRYQGPTSIMNLVTEGLEKLGIENVSLTLRLPYYAQLEEDYTGGARLLEALREICDLPRGLADAIAADALEGERQCQRISAEVANNPEARTIVQRLEAEYDARAVSPDATNPSPPLSPEVERFLREIDST